MTAIPLQINVDEDMCSDSCPFLNGGTCLLFNESLDLVNRGNGPIYSRAANCFLLEYLHDENEK